MIWMRRLVSLAGCVKLPIDKRTQGANKETSHEEEYQQIRRDESDSHRNKGRRDDPTEENDFSTSGLPGCGGIGCGRSTNPLLCIGPGWRVGSGRCGSDQGSFAASTVRGEGQDADRVGGRNSLRVDTPVAGGIGPRCHRGESAEGTTDFQQRFEE